MPETIPPHALIFLYGPPGSGKSTLGRLLARALARPFIDLDSEIESRSGAAIAEIFATEGEPGFRRRESACLMDVLESRPAVIALGGGALLDEANRGRVEAAGTVLCLNAAPELLLQRTRQAAGSRPLLGSSESLAEHLAALLQQRSGHYASFQYQLDTSLLPPEAAAWEAQVTLGIFRVSGMGSDYEVAVQPGALEHLGAALEQAALRGPLALVTDEHIAPHYLTRASTVLAQAGYAVIPVVLPAGEAHKTIHTITRLWEAFISGGLERSSTVAALGGGVVTDLAGFAAATYLRGVCWAAVPTTLLGMVDASLGGKTGIDLPQGKNLAGAFYPPNLVLADPEVLDTLPAVELRSGLAEVVKHGIIDDPALFALCAGGWDGLRTRWNELVRRGMAVKIQFIQADPYEKGQRAALNLGHTLGHAFEQAAGFTLRHGDAVAAGMVAETRLSERIGLAPGGLAAEIAGVLERLGLPTRFPPAINRQQVLDALARDKKKLAGQVRFALPVCIGEVRTGIVIEKQLIEEEIDR